uniref:Gustatory receptor n=1 Tax=Anopheles christyi TaxID=43041 RepID=A0A182K6B4_9DIPT
MSSYYRRHAPIFQVAALLYLVPCSYNAETEQFEQRAVNKLAFAFGIMMTVPFWYFDLKFMIALYLENISPIMVAVGSMEIAVYVSIVSCTLLNTFGRRNRYTRLMNVLFHADWLLDRYERIEKEYDNRRHFATLLFAVMTMVCCNMVYHRDMKIRILSFSVALKIFGVCYLAIIHRICVGAIGVRMRQLSELCKVSHVRHLVHVQEQTVYYIIERFELYAAQLRRIDQCFSLPLTMIILLVLIEMVYLMFDIFLVLELDRPLFMENLEIDYIQWTLRQMWQTIYGAVVLLTVTGCQRTSEEVGHIPLQQTAQLVRQVDDDRSRNSRATKKIQHFLLQNLGRKSKFSVCGMFDIDYAMLHMVFSSIITYLVILVQFDQLQPERLSYTSFNTTASSAEPKAH